MDCPCGSAYIDKKDQIIWKASLASGSLPAMAEPLNGLNMSRGLLDMASPAGEGLLLYL